MPAAEATLLYGAGESAPSPAAGHGAPTGITMFPLSSLRGLLRSLQHHSRASTSPSSWLHHHIQAIVCSHALAPPNRKNMWKIDVIPPYLSSISNNKVHL